MATATVSKPWFLYLLWVLTSEGISFTQVTQVVAQKFTRVTLPLRSAVVTVAPSSSMKVDAGASSRAAQPVRTSTTEVLSASSMDKNGRREAWGRNAWVMVGVRREGRCLAMPGRSIGGAKRIALGRAHV